MDTTIVETMEVPSNVVPLEVVKGNGSDFIRLVALSKPNPLKGLVKAGNKKLPKTTAIFNMGSATDCPALKKGMCQAFARNPQGKMKLVCYAKKAEVQYYTMVLPYRRRQEKYWKDHSAEDFAISFLISLITEAISLACRPVEGSSITYSIPDKSPRKCEMSCIFWVSPMDN